MKFRVLLSPHKFGQRLSVPCANKFLRPLRRLRETNYQSIEFSHIIVETSTLFLNLENGYGNVVTDLVKTNSHLISTNTDFVQINSQ